MSSKRFSIVCLGAASLLSGCASFSVQQVTAGNDATVKGQRYFLPKPFLVVAPKADGTVSVDVVYLPDTAHEYAISAKSLMSTYAVQIVPDQAGLLSSITYKRDSTTIAQQLASTGGAIATQAANVRIAQAVADQAPVEQCILESRVLTI